MTAARDATIADLRAENAALRAERDAATTRRESDYSERIAHQAATIEVLKLLSSSPGDPRPLFDLIVRKASVLCDSTAAALYEYDGSMVHCRFATISKEPERTEAFLRQFPRPLDQEPDHGATVAIRERRVVHIRDAETEGGLSAASRRNGIRSAIAIPLIRAGAVVGVLALGDTRPGGYTDSQVELLKTLAEQAVIAITSAETSRALQQRTAELAERNEAFAERIDHQAATIDVLKTMSASPGNPQPVFDLICQQAKALLGTVAVALFEYDGHMVHHRATHGANENFDAASNAAYFSSFPMRPDRGSITCRAILDGTKIHIRDLGAEPGLSPAVRGLGHKTQVTIPLMRDRKAIGAITTSSFQVDGVTDTQVELLETFAEQAVIAITSAETYRALEERTADLEESLEQQTATAEVLQVINTSPGDLAPVFEAILEQAHVLCGAEIGALTSYDGEFMRAVAVRGLSAEHAALITEPFRPSPGGGVMRLIDGARFSQMADMSAEHVPGFSETFARRTGLRTYLGIPLRKEGVFVGQISAYRSEVRPFAEKEIALLENFAAQAVIAMENARLLTETREALEQQTATAEILRVINASPGHLAPVFDTILEQAMRLCGAVFGTLGTWDGTHQNQIARRGYPAAYEAWLDARGPTTVVTPAFLHLLETRRPVQLADTRENEGYRSGNPTSRALADLGGARTVLAVPLLKDETVIGYITVYRQEVRPFADKEVALLERFAAHAVIAMENARLLDQLRERNAAFAEQVAHQEATIDVLKVMSSTTNDTQPVFDMILSRAIALSGASSGGIFGLIDGMAHVWAMLGFDSAARAAYIAEFPHPFSEQGVMGRAILQRRTLYARDYHAENPHVPQTTRDLGYNSLVAVPLLRDGEPIGVLVVVHERAHGFTAEHIALLETFAEQAVISIGSVGTFRALQSRTADLQESLEQQTATAELLQVINASPGNLAPVFDAMLESAMRLSGVAYGLLRTFDGKVARTIATRGLPDALVAFSDQTPLVPSPGSTMDVCVTTRRPAEELDLRESEVYRSGNPGPRAMCDLGGARTVLFVPLVKDNVSVGFFTFYRQEVRSFAAKEVALLESFAAQAVIAMENARLLTEQQEALARQTAMADILAAINAHPGNPQPAFDTILAHAHALCGADHGSIRLYDGDLVTALATHGVPDDWSATIKRARPISTSPLTHPLIVAGERRIHYDDYATLRDHSEAERQLAMRTGTRSYLVVALRRGEETLGCITAARFEVRPFAEKEIALLESFAAQAVIAIENARLLTEQQEALARQTAMADILAAINAHPGNPQPAFDAILAHAHTLCDTDRGSIILYDGDLFTAVATHGFPDEWSATVKRGLPISDSAAVHVLIAAGERSIHYDDTAALPSQSEAGRQFNIVTGTRSYLAVALRRGEKTLGCISAARTEVRPFTDKEIALLESFAAQAVIAMENARLLSEQREALEQQTAMAEVLEIINLNPGEVQPVFDAILERAHRICKVNVGAFGLYDGKLFRVLSAVGYPPATEASLRAGFAPQPVHEPLFRGERCYTPDRERRAWTPEDEFALFTLREAGLNTIVLVPLFKDGTLLGFISAARHEVVPFSDREIALLENFASQAVIAMENARLLTEQREALEQQTATAEVLKVISRSAFDLQPVLDTLIQSAVRLCEATRGSLALRDGDVFAAQALAGSYSEEYRDFLRRNPVPAGRGTVTGRAALTGAVQNVPDVTVDPEYQRGDFLRESGNRAFLAVPLLRDGRVEGVLSLTRQHPAAFTERQVELVQTFAAQAVIAMENARLLTEQQEALARQTAMADILAAINAHPGNPQPAFDTILAHAHALCDSERGSVMLYDGDQYSAVATRGFPDDQSAAIRGGLPISKSPWAHALIAAGHRSVNVPDLRAVSGMSAQDRGFVERSEPRSYVAVALRRGDDVLGCITAVRTAVRPFSDKEIALLDSFAAQAVIAIENARLLTELRASLERQTATAEVLQIINANPGHLQPVFDAILEKAHGLCEATLGSLQLLDGETLRAVATRGVPEALDNILRAGYRARRGFLSSCGGPEQMIDLAAELAEHPDSELLRTVVEIGGFRTMLAVPLHKDGTLLGRIVAARTEVRPFADNEIGLIASFAAQAVIAMENARLLTELRARTDELAARNSDFAERIDQQAATIDVLKVMSASPGDPQPVFDLIVRRAPELCNGASAVLLEYDGTLVHFRAMHYLDARSPAAQEADEVYRNRYPMPPTRKLNSGRAILDGKICHIRDVEAAPDSAIETTRISALRSEVVVPLLRDGASIGVMMLTSRHVGGFSDSQVELLQTFAEQAVIAIAAAAAFRALQQRTAELAQRQDELRVTFENMNDGVALFDEHHCLVAWNANFPCILDLPEDTLVPGRPFADYIRTLAEHGEYGEGANVEEQVTRVLGLIGERRIFERARPGGRTVEVRNNPVADGGFVLIYADITERKRAEAEIAAARDAAEQSARTIEAAYRDLKIAQANLIQAEKMASLGQLTAGIAHEIKNPLNFVNNFSALSTELIDELREVLAPQPLIGAVRAEIDELTSTLRGNLEKVVQHGRRADGIVKSMLEHSRGASTERRAVDFNALVEEALNLAYHGARAQDQSFNVALERAYADDLAPIELNPQDITRVLLNLIGNGFHAARQRAVATQGHEPTLGVTTRALGGAVEIRVRDNGTGIPTDIRDRIFEPFFTTKPTGEGTGLGLSITYDIVTKQHGGTIEVDSAPGAFTEFTVTLPRSSDGAPA